MNVAANFETENDLIKRKRVRHNPWQDATLLSVLIMQLCWLVPWYRVVTMSPENINPYALDDYLLFAGLMLLPYAFAWGMERMQINRKTQKTILWGLLFVLIAVSLFSPVFIRERVNYMDIYSQSPGDIDSYRYYVPNEIIVVLVVFYLWRMGSNVVHHGLGTKGVIGQFITGLILFVAYIFLNRATGTNFVPGLEIFIFLFFGLLGLATTRIAMLRRLVGGSVSPFSLKWLGSIAGATLGIFSLAFGFAWLVGGDVARWLISTITGAAMAIITFLISPLFYVTQWIINTINANVEYGDQVELVQTDVPDNIGSLLNDEVAAQTGPSQFVALAFFVGIILVVLVVFIIALIYFSEHRKKPEAQWEQDVLYERTGSFMDALRSLLRTEGSLAKRWQEFRVRLADRINARERIRYIFACLLDMAEDINIPKPSSDTPLEFTDDLVRLFPEDKEDLLQITNAYNRVRYGRIPETEEEVKAVEYAWLVVRESGLRYMEKLKIRG